MTVRAELADGRVLEFPDGTDPSVIQSTVKRMIAAEPRPQPEEGITAALTGGFKRFLSTGETALESLVDPELAAQRGVERAQKIGEQYAPGASLEKVKQAYAERGLLPAVGEAISQIPSALAEQAPQIAATLGSAKLGAMAGSPLGPVGALVGGIGGAVTPSLMQLYGANLERQAGEKVPEISRSAALAAAAPGAALEVASTFIPLGRNLVGKLLGPNAEKALARGSNEAIERKAQEALTTSLLKGTAVGSAVEIPTEVTQQMLERLQAGLPLTTEDAFKEYGEAAYGAGLVGGPFGGAARVLGRPAARAEFEKIQQEEADRLAVSEEELAQRFPNVLPGGFKINREEVGREMAPEGFSIMVEGRDEPLSVVDTQEEADEKLASLTQIRERERENLLKDEEKINTDIQKAKDRLEQLEATEQTDTDDYKALKAELPTMMDESAQKIKDLYDKSAALAKPLTVMPFGEVERVNEQFNVIGPDNKPVGSFKTLGEAESVVEQAVGKDTFKQTQQNREVAKDLYKNFVPQMRKFGLGDVGLNIVDRIENGAGGAYLDKLIRVSLEEEKPVQTMRHESLHAMKDLGFFTPQQWKALEERANKEWIKTYLEGQKTEVDGQEMTRLEGYKKLGYTQEAIVEEAIADAFGAYDKGAKPPPGMIAALFRKIKNFFSSVGQAFRGAGFQSADDIFQNIERGRLKPAAQAKPAVQEKLSLAPQGIPQKIWDLHEKVLQTDLESTGEVARGLTPGGRKRNQTMSFRRLDKAVMEFVGGDEQKANDLMVKMNEESSSREREAEEKLSLKRPAVKDEIEISTQNPSGVKRTYDPIAQMLSIDEKAVMEAMKANPRYRKKTIEALKSYGFMPKNVKDQDAIELFKSNIVNNLLFLYNLVPENIRQRSKLWYDGANKISQEMADKYGLSLRQVSAIMAAMSPQKDWFQNVSMGERAIDILTQHGDRSWSPEMLRYAESYVKEEKKRPEREKRQEDFEKIKRVAEKGTPLKDMDIKSAAAFIRAYDEAFHSRQYRIVTPEGGFGDIVRNNDGTPSTMMWSTYGPIEKAVSIFRDGSRENISEQLGFEHKIRSFYNNIAAPNSDLEHVTIDTHAVAAALFESLAGTDPEVLQNFGGTGTTDITGVGGTYGLIAEAYRDAAKQVGVLPREMQSITWEAVRGLFSEEIKSSLKGPVKAEWAKYRAGEQTFEEAREKIIDISRSKRSNDKNVDIPPPDWVGSDQGQFVEDGGESYDKSYIPEGGVRLRQEQEIRDKLTFNLSAVTRSIPGLNELYDRALKRDEGAVEVLQGVANSSLTHLLSGTKAKVAITRAKGVYLSDREPSLMVSAAFNESEGKDVMAALARFAKNFNQEQIHVRMPTKKKVGFDYGDGSYVTPVYTTELKKQLSDRAISDIIDKSGLKGFTVTEDKLIAYYVRPVREEGESNEQYAKRSAAEFEVFEKAVDSAHVLAGVPGKKAGRKAERLFVYGSGYGAEISYESIVGDVRPKQSADTVTPKLIAEYLTGKPVQVFKQKPLNKSQVAEQQKLAQIFDTLPVNDLKNPLVKKAYKALNKALKEQFAVLPVKVEFQKEVFEKGDTIPDGFKVGDLKPPYNNDSAAMRRDIIERNHILVYPTTPETFGPKGQDFSGHPLLEDSGFKTIDNKPMLFNDVLRAVHDYFAHGMSEAQFGPNGEFTAWRNHMASTADPMARWALTAETRLQNAWQNFRPGVEGIAIKDRPFATQKAALPPVEFLFTGDNAVDLPTFQMVEGLSDKDKQGSKPAKYSLKNVRFPTVESVKEAVKAAGTPDSVEFKQYNAGNQWVDADGRPKVFYHATARNFFEFTPAGQSQAIFLAETPEEAETFGSIAEDKLRREVYRAINKEEKLGLLQGVVNEAVQKKTITEKQGQEFMRQANRKVPEYGDFGDIEQEVYDALLNLSPTRMSIMPLYARAMAPFDFENKEHVNQVIRYIESGNAGDLNMDFPEKWLAGMKGRISQGLWQAIEDKRVQQAIRALGFDAFTVRENRASAKNYAVYQPQQVKSVTGNDGQFSLETKDVRYSLRHVGYTPQRVNQLLSTYAYTQGGAEKDTKAYVGRVNPKDFLNATATRKGLERIRSEVTPLDVERLMKETQPIFLEVREGEYLQSPVWEIKGHEGRHRMMALADAGYDSVPVVFDFGNRVKDTKPIKRKYIVRQKFQGVGEAMQDLMVENLVPVSYDQIDALREFEKTEGVKYSLPTLSQATNDRIKDVTPGRVELGWKDRVIGTFKQDYTGLRQKFLNRYETLGVNDRLLRDKIKKAGGPDLLADQSAEFAAFQSDLSAGVAASAMGIGDRQGGVPVYRNGLTTIDTSVKGLVESLAPLAKYGDQKIYQRYQFWAGWKRGRRLLREGREDVYTAADAKVAQEIENAHPEFIQVQKDLIAFNNGIVKYAVQTGVLSRERAQVYTQYADYIPFYRQLDLDKTIGPNPFGGISGVKGPKELKGGDSPLGDFLENMVRNTQSMINAGMKNAAAQRATNVAMQINNSVTRLPAQTTGVGFDVYTQLENGQVVYYRSADPLFIEALKSLNMPDLPFMGLLSAPANVLRNLVTKDPGFMMANLLRDSLSSYVTSGQKVTPIVGTMVNFGKALTGKDKTLQALFNAGAIGGYEFSQNIEQSGKSLSADLNKKAGKDPMLLRPFKSLWEGLEKGTTASDAATRMAVYERVMAETGNEAEAISRAMEVMNFNRKGNSVLIRIATAALPFFNARLQGLDLFYRASAGQMNSQDAQEIKRRFWIRGMTMASLSVMYYLSVADDEEYEKQEEETKDNNWIFTSLGIRIPIPFEVGTLFKTMPERITAYFMGNDTGKDLAQSTLRALANTFAFNPIPQTFKPIIEAATNYNFFTMRPIVGQGMQEVEPKFQVSPGTSKTAEYIGGLLNLSPLKVDQLIKGYTGTIGGYVTDVVDSIANEFSDVPKASKRFEQLPVVKRFALDPEARGSVTQFYELQRSVDTVVRTMSLLEKTARPEEYAEYLQKNIGVLAVKDYVRDIEKSMKELRDMRRFINSTKMDADEKRDIMTDIGRAEINLTANIKEVKKVVSALK